MADQNTLTNLQQGTHGKSGEIIDWSYWDTATLATAAGVTVTQMFQVALGQGGKTIDVTNMITGGQIPQGQNFKVHCIKAFYITAAAKVTASVQLLYKFIRQTTIEITIPGKDSMGQWTLAELLGTATLIAETPTAAGDNIPIIQPKYHGVFKLNTPLTLAALTPFAVKMTNQVIDASQNGDFVMISLNGTLKRAS